MVNSFGHRRTQKRVESAKRAARPELTDFGWETLGLAKSLDLEKLTKRPDQIDRINGLKVSVEQFARDFERPRVPVIISGLISNWQATKKWTFERLRKKYRNQVFKCGEDDEGYSVKLKMKYFLDYMKTTQDDSPLYIFDSSFGERSKPKALLEDYKVPAYFRDDLFDYVSEKRRPPYRWFVMGPARSGTGIHIDPLGTSAWNGLVVGRKKWVLIPPHVPKAQVKPPSDVRERHPDEATTWFTHVYPRLLAEKDTDYGVPFIECVQHPGEIMFVPSGWWHVVINVDDTIALTQNFCSLNNLEFVWRKTKRSRPKMHTRWMHQLSMHRPDAMRLIERYKHVAHNGKEERESEGESSDDSSSSSSSSSDSESESHAQTETDGVSETDHVRIPKLLSRERKRRCSHQDENECLCKLRRSPKSIM
ncbi:hypothetical protein QR680_002710 [Steinernema hermaphroditum]|uniref:JmjC domain-containing protein n=1 Tax=Steinernema hermaphroditum TaxID=289476 RepID=A0AA39H3R8_9BILA|nr:hypothetical protein QR680_002710 [Steinernema hermaphroditum]